jgi:hypothetical protein
MNFSRMIMDQGICYYGIRKGCEQKLQADVNVVMNLQILWKVGNFLTS